MYIEAQPNKWNEVHFVARQKQVFLLSKGITALFRVWKKVGEKYFIKNAFYHLGESYNFSQYKKKSEAIVFK